MQSVAKPHRRKNGYLSLSTSKTWITHSPIADVLLVWARYEPTGKIRGFLVNREDCPPGILDTPAIKNKNGLRASLTGMIHLDECPAPEANTFPDVEGLRGPITCLNNARYGIALGVTGALEDCIARARLYTLERKQFKNNPIAKYQLVQKKLADAVTDATDGTNCDRALANARALHETFGGNAVRDEYRIGRHVSNLFVVQTYEGQSDIHSLILGRAITGLQAFV